MNIVEMCRREGVLLTPYRRAVIEAFESTDEMMDTEQVYERANRTGAKVDRATVYRSIRVLRDIGAVKVGAIRGRVAYYQKHSETPRISLVDVKRGTMTQIADDDLVEQIVERLRMEGYQLAGGIDLRVTRPKT